MPTRRDFLTAGAAVTAALAGEKAGRLEAASEEGSAKRQPHDKPGGKRSSLRLHLLGCGYPPPYGTGDRIRHGSAFLLEVGPELLLIDCGPATTYKMARMGIIMGTDEVRSIAESAGVRRVVLTHNGSVNTPEKRQPFLDAVSQVFRGEVCFPDELTTIDLQN